MNFRLYYLTLRVLLCINETSYYATVTISKIASLISCSLYIFTVDKLEVLLCIIAFRNLGCLKLHLNILFYNLHSNNNNFKK